MKKMESDKRGGECSTVTTASEKTGGSPSRRGAFALLKGLPGDLKVLLGGLFLSPLANAMVIPYAVYYMLLYTELSPVAIGFVVGFSGFIKFSGGFLGGVFGEKIGLKTTILLGVGIRCLGCLFLVLSVDYSLFAVPAFLIVALGGAFFIPTSRAYLVVGVDKERQPFLLSISNALINLGFVVGPPLSGFFIRQNPRLVFEAILVVFVMLLVMTATSLRSLATEAVLGEKHLTQEVVRKGTSLIVPCLIVFFVTYFFFSFHNYLLVYLDRFPTGKMYEYLLMCNAGMIAVIQPALSGFISRSSYRLCATCSFLSMAIGFFLLSFGSSLLLVFVGVVMITLGEVFLFLKNDLVFLDLFEGLPALAFGMKNLFVGLGALGGGALGGYLYKRFSENDQPEFFWFLLAGQCLVLLGFSYGTLRRKRPG